MKLLRDLFRLRLAPRRASHVRRTAPQRTWTVTVPAPRAKAEAA